MKSIVLLAIVLAIVPFKAFAEIGPSYDENNGYNHCDSTFCYGNHFKGQQFTTGDEVFVVRSISLYGKLGYMGTDVFINVGVLIWKPSRVKIGGNTHINAYCQIIGHDDAYIEIGESVHISHNVVINGRGGVTIGNGVGIGANSAIYSATHYHKFPDGRRAAASNMRELKDQFMIVAPVYMHDNTTVRWGCIVLPGVEIGEWSIIGANSMVKDSVPAETIVAGNPAKKIGENKQEVV